MNRNTPELTDIKNIIEQMKNDPDQTQRLKKEVHDKGLEPKIQEFQQKYGDKINEMMRSINEKGDMTDEEKARMILNMKKSLPKDTQKQLSSVISAMKEYMKGK